jgi:hypothetical protein
MTTLGGDARPVAPEARVAVAANDATATADGRRRS